jgi:hypothetical protein
MTVNDVDMAFADLEACHADLKKSLNSPRDVRRSFARFVTLAQQLTAAMRREFSSAKGRPWDAARFPGWSAVSDLFKELRNADQHEGPIQVLVQESVTAQTDLGALVTLTGTWELHNQLADEPPGALVAVRADPVSGQPSDSHLPIVGRSFRFLIQPRTEKIRELLESAGSQDIHNLASEYMDTLRDYLAYYKTQLART